MKRFLITAAIIMIATSGAAFAAVLNTAHDLSTQSTSGETCVFCHTPHNASPAVPLWNGATSAQTFTTYTSDTMDATETGWTGGAGNISDLCMSCHDGVVSVGTVQIGRAS